MMIDKAVFTDTMTDSGSAINYENLLSTLVQKKILAIKRECDGKKKKIQKRKQQNSFGSRIFGNFHGRNGKCNEARQQRLNDNEDENGVTETEVPYLNPTASLEKSKQTIPENVDRSTMDSSTTLNENQYQCEQIDSNILLDCGKEIQRSVSDATVSATQSNECNTGQRDNNSTQTMTDDIFKNELQTDQHNSNSSVMRLNLTETVQCNTIETDIDASKTSKHSNSTSIISQIDVSDEINTRQTCRTKDKRSDSISVPGFIKRTSYATPGDLHTGHDPEHRREIRVFEAKSISAQCSPIFSQRQSFHGKLLHALPLKAIDFFSPFTYSINVQHSVYTINLIPINFLNETNTTLLNEILHKLLEFLSQNIFGDFL